MTTNDLYFAAFLLSNGIELRELTTRYHDRGVTFTFPDNDTVMKLRVEYYNRGSKIEPNVFVDNIRRLKAAIYDEPTITFEIKPPEEAYDHR